jgi:hypothetical protein
MSATPVHSKSAGGNSEDSDAHRQGIVYHISHSQAIRKLAGKKYEIASSKQPVV